MLFIINLIESLKVLRLKVGIPVENCLNWEDACVTLNGKQCYWKNISFEMNYSFEIKNWYAAQDLTDTNKINFKIKYLRNINGTTTFCRYNNIRITWCAYIKYVPICEYFSYSMYWRHYMTNIFLKFMRWIFIFAIRLIL